MLKALFFPVDLLFKNFFSGIVSLILFFVAHVPLIIAALPALAFIMMANDSGPLPHWENTLLTCLFMFIPFVIFLLILIYPGGYLVSATHLILNKNANKFNVASTFLNGFKYVFGIFCPFLIILVFLHMQYVANKWNTAYIYWYYTLLIFLSVITVNYSKKLDIGDCFKFINIPIKAFDYIFFIIFALFMEYLLEFFTITVHKSIDGMNGFLLFFAITLLFQLLVMGMWVQIVKQTNK